MLPLQRLAIVALVWPFSLAKISVNGSGACLTLCCDFDLVKIDGRCEKSYTTSGKLPAIRRFNDTNEEEEIVPGKNVQLRTDDPCNYEWMTSWVPKNYQVLETGSIYAEELGGKAVSDCRYYCLFRKPNSANYSAKVCRPWLAHTYWDSFVLMVAILVVLVVFISYSIVPELKNLPGLMLRSYLATYVCTYTSALVLVLTAETISLASFFTFTIFTLEYFGVACVFWLNAMSFDIWRTVGQRYSHSVFKPPYRSFRSIDSHEQIRKKKTYIWYAIYAWVTPALLTSIYAGIICYLPTLQKVVIRQIVRRYGRIAVKASVFTCNTFFYVSTALIIKRHKKETVGLADGINKHHDVEKQLVNLHVKLYLIMGGHMLPWIVWDYWPTPVTSSMLLTLEAVQSIVIFIVFI